MKSYRQLFKINLLWEDVECLLMNLDRKLQNFTFLLLGILFLVVGFSLNELAILVQVDSSTIDAWYNFLMPWVGDAISGLPTPW